MPIIESVIPPQPVAEVLPPPVAFVLLFDRDQKLPRANALAQLDALSELLAKHASEISVIGYASSRGDKIYNQSLSESRATVVADYLIDNLGAKVKQISAYGETKVAVKGHSDVANAQNRRVEVKVVFK